jgi:hypothetical protein
MIAVADPASISLARATSAPTLRRAGRIGAKGPRARAGRRLQRAQWYMQVFSSFAVPAAHSESVAEDISQEAV